MCEQDLLSQIEYLRGTITAMQEELARLRGDTLREEIYRRVTVDSIRAAAAASPTFDIYTRIFGGEYSRSTYELVGGEVRVVGNRSLVPIEEFVGRYVYYHMEVRVTERQSVWIPR